MQTTRVDLILEGGINSLYSTAKGGDSAWCVLLFWEPLLFKILNEAIEITNKGKGMRICPFWTQPKQPWLLTPF